MLRTMMPIYTLMAMHHPCEASLADYWKVAENQLVIGVGLDEVISMVNKTFINAGDSIVISVPAFLNTALTGLVEGAVIREVPCI